ncbi:hypothetical protein [Methylobacterium sp. WL103]|nr:hypothetical protein [Methylobacterium sp. WL103]
MADVKISDYARTVCLQDGFQSRTISAFFDVTQLLLKTSAGT